MGDNQRSNQPISQVKESNLQRALELCEAALEIMDSEQYEGIGAATLALAIDRIRDDLRI